MTTRLSLSSLGGRLLHRSQRLRPRARQLLYSKKGRSCSSKQVGVVVRGSIPANGNGVAVGQIAESNRIFTSEDVNLFGKLVGDENPLHQRWTVDNLPDVLENHPMLSVSNEDDDLKATKILVHGMLVSSIFSSIFGTLIPGAVYLKQTLDFSRPVYVDELVTGRIKIERIRHWRRKGLILTCDTLVLCNNEEKVRGSADVWLPHGSVANKVQ